MSNNSNNSNDKILNNSYNTGEMSDIVDGEIKLNVAYQRTYMTKEYDMEGTYRLDQLCEDLYAYVEDSKFKVIFDNRRIIKKIVPELLEYILPFLDKKDTFTFTEKFHAMTEVLDIANNIIYTHLPEHYKDLAHKELEGYAPVHERQNDIKLF